MTLAPVLDVNTNPNNAVIGDRSYGSDARVASACGAAFIDALQAGGVAGCAKHWPGHGDTEEDSHDALPASSCLLYTSPSPRDQRGSRMPSSA